MQTQTEVPLPPISEDPKQAMWSFVEDYRETAANPEEGTPQHLVELASSMGRFATQNHLDLKPYIEDTDIDAKALHDQLEQDELLSGRFDALVEKALRSEVQDDQYQINLANFGWIPGEGKPKMPVVEHKTKELTYDLVDLTGLSRVATDLQKELQAQGVLEALKTELLTERIPELWKDILSGSADVRSISIGTRSKKDVGADQSFNCALPAFKVGVDGPRNRAIIVQLSRDHKGKPLFGLVAIYDHDDDGQVHRAMFLKQK